MSQELAPIVNRLKRLEAGLHQIKKELQNQRITPGGDRNLSVSETAQLLGKSESSIYRLVREGKLPAKKIGSRFYFSESKMHELLGLEPAHA